MIIGLTGPICAGKNLVAALLEERGFPVLDVDKLGHKALDMEKDRILSQFGSDLLKTEGENQSTIDRKRLGAIVYKNAEKLAALEAIVHPAANRLSEEWAASQKGHCVVNAALLHKSTLIKKIERIILVKAPFLTRLIRLKRRDKLPWSGILKRIASQKDFYTQYLSLKAEIYIVENPGLRRNPGSKAKMKLADQIDKFAEGIK